MSIPKKIRVASATIIVRSVTSMSPFFAPEKAPSDNPPILNPLGSSPMNRYTQMVRNAGFKSPNSPSRTGELVSLKEYAIPTVDAIPMLSVKLKLEPINCLAQ